MKIGFALITASPFFEKVIEVENNIHNKAGFFDLLGNKTNLPHTTIFQGDMKNDFDYIAVAKQIKQILPTKFLTFKSVEYVHTGWYFLMCEKTTALQELHNSVLDLVRDYIVLDPNRLSRDVQNLSINEIAGITNYGYRYAGNAFCPHITIGRADSKKTDIIDELNAAFAPMAGDVAISRITVYRMGNNGTHAETLFELPL